MPLSHSTGAASRPRVTARAAKPAAPGVLGQVGLLGRKNLPSVMSKAIIMMVVCTGTMKINFFTKDPQALVGGTGII